MDLQTTKDRGIMDLQAIVDGLAVRWQKERSLSQMTLGTLIDRLKELRQDMVLSPGLTAPHSYRGYYVDLAFSSCMEISVGDLLKLCQESMGEVFEGYKGGDYMMGRNTPVWNAGYGCCGEKIMSIEDDGTIVTEKDEQ